MSVVLMVGANPVAQGDASEEGRKGNSHVPLQLTLPSQSLAAMSQPSSKT